MQSETEDFAFGGATCRMGLTIRVVYDSGLCDARPMVSGYLTGSSRARLSAASWPVLIFRPAKGRRLSLRG